MKKLVNFLTVGLLALSACTEKGAEDTGPTYRGMLPVSQGLLYDPNTFGFHRWSATAEGQTGSIIRLINYPKMGGVARKRLHTLTAADAAIQQSNTFVHGIRRLTNGTQTQFAAVSGLLDFRRLPSEVGTIGRVTLSDVLLVEIVDINRSKLGSSGLPLLPDYQAMPDGRTWFIDELQLEATASQYPCALYMDPSQKRICGTAAVYECVEGLITHRADCSAGCDKATDDCVQGTTVGEFQGRLSARSQAVIYKSTDYSTAFATIDIVNHVTGKRLVYLWYPSKADLGTDGLPSKLFTGGVDLSQEADLRQCSHCLYAFNAAGQVYWPTAGTLTVSAMPGAAGQPFTIALQGLQLTVADVILVDADGNGQAEYDNYVPRAGGEVWEPDDLVLSLEASGLPCAKAKWGDERVCLDDIVLRCGVTGELQSDRCFARAETCTPGRAPTCQ